MKKCIILLISFLPFSGRTFGSSVKFFILKEESYIYCGPDFYRYKDKILKEGEDLYPGKYIKLDKENYIHLSRECFDYITTATTINRHYTGYCKTTGTSSSGYYLIKTKFLNIIEFITRNWDKKLHGIDYCKLSQEDKQFVTNHFDNTLMKAYIRILSPMSIPEVMAALNIRLSDKELTDLNLNDEDQMFNIERLLQYWFEPHCSIFDLE